MRRLVATFLYFVCFSVNSSITAQQGENRYVVVPSEYALLVVASQPDSPLKIESAQLLKATRRGGWYAVHLRNQGMKPIRTFTLVAWNLLSDGGVTGGTIGLGRDLDEPLMPGRTFNFDCPGKVIPLTDELREKLQLRGPMKAVVVLMVQEVMFADGSSFSDEATSKALVDQFEKLGN